MLMAQEPASPGLALPVLELVYLKNVPRLLPPMLSCSSPVPQPVSPAPFVTTTRSEPPARDRVETHPVDMASFTELLAKPLEAPALQSPPRRCCTKPPPALAPRHSSRLAKKAISRMPAVVDM
jgi:hypothetical protein